MYRVLIVDDNPVARRLLRSRIEQNPEMKVCGEAENGRNGIDLFQQLSPDAVILDLAMPVMNGLEAARHMSRMAPRVPLLMCTAFSAEPLIKEAQDAGVDLVISKDQGLSNLADVIQALLCKHS